MKIADYGKAITSYIESPTTAQKLLTKSKVKPLDRTLLADGSDEVVEIDFASAEDRAFRDMMKAYLYYQKHGGKKSLREYMRMSTGAGRKGGGREHFRATGGRVHLAEGSEDIVEPSKSMQVDTTTKGLDLFTIDDFKKKAEIYVGAYHNNALPTADIKSALNKFTQKGIDDGTFSADDAIKIVQDLKYQFQDRAKNQRLRDVIIEGTGTVEREERAIGGGVIEGEDLGSREGFANIKSQSEQFRNFLRGLDKKILKDSNLADLIEQSKIDISKTTASNVLAEDEFLKIRPKRTLNVEDKNKIKKLLEGKTGRVESITYKGTDYYKASDGRIREKINLKADRPEAYKIKQAKEIEKLNLIKSKDVFPNPGKDIKFQIWKDLYESTKQRTYGPRAGDFKPPEPRLKVVKRPNDLTTAAVKNKLVLLDTKTNKKITFKNLEKYINSLPDTSFKEMSLPYKYKNWLSDQTINYKGKTNVSLRTVLRENLLTKNQLNNWKASPYQVHHPFGINENPFKVQLAMHKPNGLEGHIRLDTLKQLDKVGTNEKDVKKILNSFEKKIKNVGGIQSGVRDVLVGEELTPDRFLKNLFSEAKIGRETRPLLKKAISDLMESGQLTTADKAPIPEKTKTRDMFKKAFTTGAKTAGKIIKPLGVGFGVNAVKTAISKAEDQGLELNLMDKIMAFDSGDAEVALNNAKRRVDPEFAAAERAKDLAQMTDDFEEVGQTTFGKYNDQIKNIKLP